MKDTNKVAVPIIVNKEGKYLLITRTEFPKHKGEWGPIAGHVHFGESLEKALIREAKEELNLEVKPVKQLAIIDQDIPGDVGYWWLCQTNDSEIKTNYEIEEYKYFSSDEIKDIKLWPATLKFFKEYIWDESN